MIGYDGIGGREIFQIVSHLGTAKKVDYLDFTAFCVIFLVLPAISIFSQVSAVDICYLIHRILFAIAIL